MSKAETEFNALKKWRRYCTELGKHDNPKNTDEYLRITAPEAYEQMSDFRQKFGGRSLPFDGNHFAEARVPISRAVTAIRAFKRVKKDETKRRHLKSALAWLQSQHPWLGERTKLEINAMIAEVKRAIDDPGISLDHILDRSFYFRFHPRIKRSNEDRTITLKLGPDLCPSPLKKASIFGLLLRRLFGSG